MDGVPHRLAASLLPWPGTALAGEFGQAREEARALDRGMGLAVGRRTVFRPEDGEDFGRVADRVAAGSMALAPAGLADTAEQLALRNAIASGAWLASGRHLQHGDAGQPGRAMEVFTNCATAIAAFTKFYLLLNGSGVGRSYDDELMLVDWSQAPTLLLHLDPAHPDFPGTGARLHRFGIDMGALPWDLPLDAFTAEREAAIRRLRDTTLLPGLAAAPAEAVHHAIEDSREGWAKAVEILEAMAARRERDRVLVLDLSAIRPAGSPIRGMQGRPCSGPLSLMRALDAVRREVIMATRDAAAPMERWEQALRVDHCLSVEVQVGGARRAARMATKSWRDPGVLRFIRAKTEGGLWTANHSVMVDREFWSLVRDPQASGTLAAHARAVFAEATRCAYVNGEPGFINGDRLEDHRTGAARTKPVHRDGRDFHSERYRVDAAADLLGEAAQRAATARFPVTTNPCGEVALHVTGGYCVIGDFAPLLACPVPFADLVPGEMALPLAGAWDARVAESVRLGVRFLLRTNRMNALYGTEVRRTNRIGIGPTGLHEWAWMRFGLGFRDLLDEERGAPFWEMLGGLSAAAKAEALSHAEELGTAPPMTVTTVKPAGTTSKLFGLTEGAHLPARRHYLRWVQFKGARDPASGAWLPGSDKLLADYEARGYPLRELRSFPGMTVVGFPTVPLIQRLGIGDRLVTAPEATPAEQYRWLKLLERYWIGEERGNQVSYTLKIFTDTHDLAAFRTIVLAEQPDVRCCAVLPSRPDAELGYEYLPEEEVDEDRFTAILAGIRDEGAAEALDWVHLQCANGVCPI